MPDPSKLVVDMWWEGRDYHIVTEDGRHNVYKNAYFVDWQPNISDCPGIEVEELKVTFVPRDSSSL